MDRISGAQARRIWTARQRLGGFQDPSLIAGGWMRAVGGATPYLSLRARNPRVRRADIDALVRQDQIVVTPGVRGCVWLVPREDATLALVVGDRSGRERQARTLAKLGVSDTELDELGSAVLEALGHGALAPSQLKQALPPGLVRSLGDAGKAVGIHSTLPPVLRRLESAGGVRRVMPDGKLDTERYLWDLAPVGWLDTRTLPEDPFAQNAALIERYLTWAAPATLDEIATWSKLGKRAIRSALADLGVVEVTVGDDEDTSFALQGQLQMTMIEDDEVHLLPALDNLVSLRACAGSVALPVHQTVEVPTMGGHLTPMNEARWLTSSPMVFRGTILGFWEWDEVASQVVWGTMDKVDAAMRMTIEEAAGDLAPFLRDDLGGSFTIDATDGDERRQRRLAFVRSLQR